MRNLDPEHEQKCDALRSEFGRQCVSKLRSTHHPRVEEYIAEAEHQDGCGYWDANFSNLGEMWDDFRLYCRFGYE